MPENVTDAAQAVVDAWRALNDADVSPARSVEDTVALEMALDNAIIDLEDVLIQSGG
jgi:hypothetical protein